MCSHADSLVVFPKFLDISLWDFNSNISFQKQFACYSRSIFTGLLSDEKLWKLSKVNTCSHQKVSCPAFLLLTNCFYNDTNVPIILIITFLVCQVNAGTDNLSEKKKNNITKITNKNCFHCQNQFEKALDYFFDWPFCLILLYFPQCGVESQFACFVWQKVQNFQIFSLQLQLEKSSN